MMSARPNVHRCNCGCEVVFRRLANNPAARDNPIELQPDPKGNIEVLQNGTYRIIPKGETFDGPRFISHFATCPNKKSFRR